MPHRHRTRRTKIILDRAKYRRHQLKKILRLLLKLTCYIAVFVLAILIIWFGLDMLFRSRPAD
jgi:hypothetical protein